MSGWTQHRKATALVGALAFTLIPAMCVAQSGSLQIASGPTATETIPAATLDAEALPDAPGFPSVSSSVVPEEESGFGGQTRSRTMSQPEASHFAKTIQPGQTAPRLTVGDKILLGFRENASYTSLAGWVISAGYAQAVNGSPNYGQTGKGFLQRLGAAAARGSSENVFSDSVLAPILHQDPRYYRMGPGHNFLKRLAYSGTRGLITRTDGGHRTLNFSNVGGDLGGSALTQWYYPPLNRSFTQVMQTWGGSVGGDAVGYVVAEFLPSFSRVFHRGN